MATTDQVTRTERNARILRLHREGLSEREIARHTGVSRSTVWAVIQAAKKDA
jgi:transposase